jgi:hypothetical protein
MNKLRRFWQRTTGKLVIASLLLATALVYLPGSVIADTSFRSIKDTISSSNAGASGVTHSITASTSLAVDAGGYLEVAFPAEFTNLNVSNITCPNSGVRSLVSNSVICTYASGVAATSSIITVTGVTNPGTVGSYGFYIYNRQSGATIKEKSSFRVAIINNVLVTASVESTLLFSITGLATSTVVNGVTLSASSTFNTLSYGVLEPGVRKNLGQKLKVSTNATHGFSVTVAQDHNLVSSGGADIDSFKDGTAASTTALTWASPAGTLGNENTYGHFGLTSSDTSLTGGNVYSASKYKGFYGSNPIEVMYNNGPADGLTADVGTTTVAYSVEINALQESGDYSNTLTYVCTPTY